MSYWRKLLFSYENIHNLPHLFGLCLYGVYTPSTQVGTLEVPKVPSLSPALKLFPRQQLLSLSRYQRISRKIIPAPTSASQRQKRGLVHFKIHGCWLHRQPSHSNSSYKVSPFDGYTLTQLHKMTLTLLMGSQVSLFRGKRKNFMVLLNSTTQREMDTYCHSHTL